MPCPTLIRGDPSNGDDDDNDEDGGGDVGRDKCQTYILLREKICLTALLF